MKNIFKLGLVLFVTTGIAGLVLGGVYTLTKAPIAAEQARAKERALRETLPQAQLFQEQAIPGGYTHITGLELGLKEDGKPAGYTITITTQGYAGPLTFMVGVDTEGVVQGFKVLKHTETPGLGANATQPYFAERFVGAEGKLNAVRHAVTSSEQGDGDSADTDAVSAASATEDPEDAEDEEDLKNTDIQALTGATISSRAVVTGVNEALRMFRQELKGAMPQ